MRFRFTVIMVLISGILLAACHAQPTSNFQSVSGDFGRTWLSNFLAQNPKPAENNSSLWSWGSAPKGSMLLNDKLVPISNSTIAAANNAANWLGDTYVDPYTGKPVYDNRPVFSEPDYNTNLPPVFSSNDPWA